MRCASRHVRCGSVELALSDRQARKLATFLAPSVNKHRGLMGPTTTTASNGSKSRTRSTATSPGRGLNR